MRSRLLRLSASDLSDAQTFVVGGSFTGLTPFLRWWLAGASFVLPPGNRLRAFRTRRTFLHVAASADVRRAAVQLWTAVRDLSHTQYAMRQPMPTRRDGSVVLLVQPCDDGLHMYAEFLTYHGLAVIAVSDAWDALNAAPKADVVVTGILLAGSMDGVELITRLRHDECQNHQPIIVLTACTWAAERERAVHAGCDLFLAKPCEPTELLRHVRASLADAALQRVRGRPIKANFLIAPCGARGIAADATRRKGSS